ncbi:MAG: FG-GAP-like repeat-containing protein, partial [Dokdonella sp.]
IGGFAAPSYTSLSAAASTISGFTVADFNGDGKLDIIATATDGIVRLIGTGGGSFSTTQLGMVTGYGVIAADFNGDGKLDLATGSGNILFGDGAGGFTLAPGLRFGGGIATAGDFNGDGKNDLVVLPQDGSSILYAWIGDGTGNFSQLGTGYPTVQKAGSADLATTDLDGDGNLDVVIGSTGGGLYGPAINTNGQAHYLLGRGNGRFAGPPALLNAVLTSADFNADGKPDLLSLESVTGTPGVRPLLGDGLGGFTPGAFSATAIGIGAGSHRPLYLARDFNGDGKADLVAIEHISGTSAVVHTRLGLAGGLFAGSGPDQGVAFDLADYGNSSNRGAPAVANFNGDGKLDLAVLGFTATNRVLALLTGNGDGSFAAPLTIDAGYANAGSNISRVATADLDGDGKPDIVVADPGGGAAVGGIHVYRNLGSGVFSATVLSGGTGTPGSLDIGDVNGDGKRDLVTTSNGGTTLSIRLGNGNATFQAPLESTLPDDSFTSVVIGDIDADGKADLVLGNYSGFAWFARGDGTGHFDTALALPLVGSPAGLQLVDFDNNGHPDLIAQIGGYTLALGVYMNTYRDTLFANGFDTP